MHELHGRMDLVKSIDLLLCDLPYNVRCQRDPQNSNRDMLNAIAINACCEFAEYVSKGGGYGHMFCSAVQFASR